MTEAHLFAIGVLLAWLAGIRVYLTVFGIGIAGYFGWLDLPQALEVTTSPWVLGVSGVLAVAQLVMNRVGKSRFGNSVCEVVNQPGQFFHTASYHPRRDSQNWANAVEVSRQAMAGDADQVVPGAVYFHSAHYAPNRFFRSRERLSMVGDHIFYR